MRRMDVRVAGGLLISGVFLGACSPAVSADVGAHAPGGAGLGGAPNAGGLSSAAAAGNVSSGGSSGETGPLLQLPAAGGAGQSGSSNGGSADAADAGTPGDAGAPPAGNACEIVCDDFEGATLDAARWRVIGAAPELSTARAHSGGQSLLFANFGQTGRFLGSQAAFPSGGRLFLRAFMNFSLATVDMAGHTAFIVGAAQDLNGAELRWGQSQPGCVAQDQLLDLNHVPSDRTICSSGLVSGGNPNDFANAGVTLQANQWYCVETLFDSAVGEFRLWIDDAEVQVLHATANSWCPPQQASCAPPAPWPIPFSVVKFGTQVYNGLAGDIYYDDLALATSRIGCQ